MFHDWGTLPGRLVVVSGPSGSGKSTIARRVIARSDVGTELSISATTRPMRPGEVDGKDYHFLSREEFLLRMEAGEFLEWAEVHGNLYGTPAGPVREALASGRCVMLEIDVQGALVVRERVPSAFLVFVDVPGQDVLEARLRARATDDDATIRRRLENAVRELQFKSCYDVVILNEQLDRAVDDLASLLRNRGCGGTVTDA